MKKLTIISMSLLCLVPTWAQEEFESLLSESKVWTISYKAVLNPEMYSDTLFFVDTKLVGDTVVNGIHFMQKYRREWKWGEEIPADWTATKEYLGQDGGKIYKYSDVSKKMVLDMDISLNVEDKISYDYDVLSYFKATVVSDTILTNTDDNKSRRCIRVELEQPRGTDVWIEGIGSITLGITGMDNLLATGAIPKLYMCTDEGVIIYQATLPTAIQSVRSYKLESAIYNLQGRKLQQTPQKGLYIQNGKKVIVR